MLAVKVKQNGQLQFLGNSTQNLNFLSFACRLKNMGLINYTIWKSVLFFAVFQEYGFFFWDFKMSVCER